MVNKSSYFTRDVNAQTPNWKPNKGGEMYMLQKQNPDDISYKLDR